MAILKSEAVKAFLKAKTHADLAELYSRGMEVQVNVGQDKGKRIEIGAPGTKPSYAYTDDLETWRPFRIPAKAMSEPVDNDGVLGWNFEKHVEGIGLTGWNWSQKKSLWVAYDFDSMMGHSEKHAKRLTEQQLIEIQNVVTQLPFVTLRRSTSGNGLHLYIFLEPIDTATHTEHAALARAILSYITGLTGFNFTEKVDIAGGNMWIWHRKMLGTNGLSLVRKGEVFPKAKIPLNWMDHINVISRRSTRIIPKIQGVSPEDFQELSGQRAKVHLDAEHLKLINWLNEKGYPGWWDADNHMLVTHTFHLKEAINNKELGFRGIFDTVSEGREAGYDINCLAGDTEVITRTGVMTLKEIAQVGQADLLVWDGKNWVWQNAPVKSFGIQKTRPILFGNGFVVRATNNHRWLYRKSGQVRTDTKYTYELQENKTELPIAQRKLPTPDPRGIAHGFVYGDGYRYEITKKRGNYGTRVTFFGEKDQLFDLVSQYGKPSYEHRKKYGRLNVVNRLPEDWKELPENPTQEYALGFIIGLLSADGFVHGPLCSIQQSGDYEEVHEIWKIAVHAGLYCRGIKEIKRQSGYESNNQHWKFYFSTYNLTKDHLLRESHKTSLSVNQKSKATVVQYLGQEDHEEEVFCAVVPRNHNFTLANGVTTGNCFLYPLRDGAWAVRRYGRGTQETKLWVQDGKGWTKTFFNRELTLSDVARMFDAVELESGGYQFPRCTAGQEALLKIGIDVQLPMWIQNRVMKVKESRQDYKVLVLVPSIKGDNSVDMGGWLEEKGFYRRLYNNPVATARDESSSIGDYDDVVRHIVSENGEDLGWVINTDDGIWRHEPVQNVKLFLVSKGIGKKDIDIILGRAVNQAWRVVNRPFEPEYPGDREWNRSSARFKIVPSIDGESLSFPTWLKVLNHCGRSLDESITQNEWCKQNGITTGGQYLKLWLASLLKFPQQPLPYLALYGPQDSGKSTLHEAFCQLILDGGYMDGALALNSQGSFNGELQDSILCTLEEVDLRHKTIYNRVKDWVTSHQISIHIKGQTPYKAPNYTHWIQCANERDFIPVFPGDTRVVVMFVSSIPDGDKIPKRDLWTMLQKESPDFLAALLATDIPDSRDRLMVPVIKTADKMAAEYAAMSPVEQFFRDNLHHIEGAYISFDEAYEAFKEMVGPEIASEWGKIKFAKAIPQEIPSGRINGIQGAQRQWKFIGNVTLNKDTPKGIKWISAGLFMKRAA